MLASRLLAHTKACKCTDVARVQARNNGELLANLGNFVNRVLKFIDSRYVEGCSAVKCYRYETHLFMAGPEECGMSRRYDGQIPAATAEAGQEAVAALGRRVAPIVEAYTTAMEVRRIKDGIRLAMDASREGNAFFQVSSPTELTASGRGWSSWWLCCMMCLVSSSFVWELARTPAE